MGLSVFWIVLVIEIVFIQRTNCVDEVTLTLNPDFIITEEDRRGSFELRCAVNATKTSTVTGVSLYHDGDVFYNSSSTASVSVDKEFRATDYQTSLSSEGEDVRVTFTRVDLLHYGGRYVCEFTMAENETGLSYTRNETGYLSAMAKPSLAVVPEQLMYHGHIDISCKLTFFCSENKSSFNSTLRIFHAESGDVILKSSSVGFDHNSSCRLLTTGNIADVAYQYNTTTEDGIRGRVVFFCDATLTQTPFKNMRSSNIGAEIASTWNSSCKTTSDDCLPPEMCIEDCEDMTCRCPHTHYLSNGVCKPVVKMGSQCTGEGQCEGLMSRCGPQDPENTGSRTCTCDPGFTLDEDLGLCTNIEPCPEDKSFLHYPEGNACYKLVSVNYTEDVWSACAGKRERPLSFNVQGGRKFLHERLWTYGLYSESLVREINALPSENSSLDILSFLISTNITTDEHHPKTWYWPLTNEPIQPESLVEAGPKCGLSLVYNESDFRYQEGPECSENETVNIVCVIYLPDKFCEKDVDDEGRFWNYTEGGTQLKQECKPGYTGSITRDCRKDGVFLLPYYNCTWAVLKDLSEQLANGTVTGAEALANLTASVTDGNRTLYIGDLLQAQNILEAVVSENSTFTNDSIYDFLETASFLIDDEANGEQWQSSIQNTNEGAESLLSVLDDFAVRLSDSLASSTITQDTVTKPNIVLTYSSVADTDEDSPPLQFPSSESRNSPGDEWQSEPHSSVNINLKALKGGNVSTFVGLVYKNLSQAVPTKLEGQEDNETRITISSQVLSLHLLPHAPVKLDPEIQLNFKRFEETNGTRFNDFCAFWNTTTESWSTSGCHVVSSNGSQVQCACNHLTNFALLMSPYKSTNEVLQKISMVITYIGCGLSILALIVTIALHAFYWKILRSERESLTMCLCVVLVLANILFLAGIGQTENQTVCRWIAVSLHVVFLTVFFTMLSFGLYVYFAVAVVFKSGKYKLVVLFLVAFVPPIAVVLTAASISKLEGYGTKASCWLDVDHWMFWTFAGPAAFVILVNGIIILIVLVKMCGTQAAKNKDALDRIKMTITALSVLLPLMGLGWVFGLFAVNKKTQWFQIVFCFFNALQGVFIFIFHCLLNKQLKRAIQLSRERKRTLDEFNDEQKKRMATGTQDSSSDNTKGTYTSETGTIEQSEARERTTSVKLEDVRLELKERMAELFTADGEVISGRQLLHKHKGSTEGVHTDKGLSLHKDSSKIHNEPSKYHSNSEETTFSNDCNPFIPTENTIEKESLELSTKVDRYVTNGDDSNRFVKDCDSISHISQLKDSNKSDVLEILNNTNNDDLHHDTSIEGHSQLDASDDEELKSDNLNGNHTAKEKLRTIDAKEAVDQTIESENLYDNVKTRIFTDGTFDAIEDEKKEKAFDQNESNETALHRIL
ncbi:adhesion G protein-coupled receptor L3-like [Mya arenaria]|uniref:adhesion G protein-coupled receptor L3-like n=1 Tax=Mya arenaria TaxID=6604 RepID=UPI0022E50B91|nr:adhesion G protein-coupled receptor L3-like [Mya arenaria]